MDNQPLHFPIAPSSAERIERCPGSVKLSVGLESKSTAYADDGTEAHGVAETHLRQGLVKVVHPDPVTRVAVQKYLDFCFEILAKEGLEEHGIEFKKPHAEIADFGGTVDFFAVYVENGIRYLHVVDYKHGVGKFVDHVRNRQMQSYAAIWLSNNTDTRIDRVRMSIVQPRSFECDVPCRTYETDVSEIYAWENLLRSVIGSNFLRAGSHCQFCPAKLVCPKIKEHTLKIAQTEFLGGHPEPEKVQDELEWLLEIDRVGDAVKGAIEAAKQRILELLQLGIPVPGYKLVEKLGNRKWKLPDEELESFFELLGVERKDYVESSIISPAAADKLVGKEIVNTLCIRPALSVTVTDADSPGKPFKPGSEFSNIDN